MRGRGGWETRTDYARFLNLQFAARLPVERWIEAHAPFDLRAPAQSHLIARDLETLGEPCPLELAPFPYETGGNIQASALGVSWVLAGSSLGNRSILKEIERAGHGDWPTAFLADPEMLRFWKQLRPRIDLPASLATLAASSAAATAVFDHFIAHTIPSFPAAAA